MTPVYVDPLVELYLGDCLEVMPGLEAESVDAVVTDPPYGLGFMGKHWDHGVPNVDFWREMYRVAKPGAHLLAFGGTRTIHRIMTNIEDAGWEIRDLLSWIYASGFPKSLDVSKALDKVAGAEREVVGSKPGTGAAPETGRRDMPGKAVGVRQVKVDVDITAPATDLARKWQGWGTALKPAHEPIVMARKPLVGSVAANVTRYGVGALNIDGARIGAGEWVTGGGNGRASIGGGYGSGITKEEGTRPRVEPHNKGRWPSNVLLSDPELFDEPNPEVVGSGATSEGQKPYDWSRNAPDGMFPLGRNTEGYGDSGGYSRFFLIPKADRAERERGLAGRDKAFTPTMNDGIGGREHSPDDPRAYRANVHPTVKPIDLMRHLVKLVTPPGGTCLDPFLGSGTTALAASELGIKCIGIEREPEYLEIAKGRLMATPMGFGLMEVAGSAGCLEVVSL